MKEKKTRILLVSDMHYTTDESQSELSKRVPGVQVSLAAGEIFGISQKQKIEKLRADLIREHEAEAVDAVLVLGDLSIDDYDYRKLPENYCLNFKRECMDRLPCPSFAIPGNHDSYPEEMWRAMFGNGRQFVFEMGSVVFFMLDTFARIAPDPKDPASGSGRTVVDSDFLRDNLRRYAGANIILCAHYFDEESFTREDRALIAENHHIRMLICGHTHIHRLGSVAGKPLIDIGGYGYSGKALPDGYTFQIFDPAWAWGYQMLEITETQIACYHVQTDQHYEAQNGIFDREWERMEALTLPLL